MALRGIQEYITRDVNNIARVEDEGNIVSIEGNKTLVSPEKEPSNIIIIIHIGLCVSSYYLTIVGDYRLPVCHRLFFGGGGGSKKYFIFLVSE